MNKYWWFSAFIIMGVLLGTGVLFLVTRPPRGEPIVLAPPPTPAPIMVYVSGAVNKAGLYQLPPDSRVNDAIQSAGGFSDDANPNELNLAKTLEDGEQIVVLRQAPPSIPDNGSRAPNAMLSPVTPVTLVTLVNINSATLEQLETLPEIGPITAQAIIDYRNANGPFARIEDIMDVPGIGQGKFETVKDLITVGKLNP